MNGNVNMVVRSLRPTDLPYIYRTTLLSWGNATGAYPGAMRRKSRAFIKGVLTQALELYPWAIIVEADDQDIIFGFQCQELGGTELLFYARDCVRFMLPALKSIIAEYWKSQTGATQ